MNEAELRSKALEARRKVVTSPLVITSGNSSVVLSPKTAEWSPTAIRLLAAELTGQVINEQRKLNNDVERITVDGSIAKSVLRMNSNITTVFEAGDDIRPIMNALLSAARTRVPGVSFKWHAIATGRRQAELSRDIIGQGPVMLQQGERIVLAPRSDAMAGGVDATFRSILFKRGISPDGRGRFKKKGAKRPKGYYAMAVQDVRAFARRRGVNVRAIHSYKHATSEIRRTPPGFPPGSGRNRISQFTGEPVHYQGTWAFSISLSVIKGRR